jgi:hypothetical protein
VDNPGPTGIEFAPTGEVIIAIPTGKVTLRRPTLGQLRRFHEDLVERLARVNASRLALQADRSKMMDRLAEIERERAAAVEAAVDARARRRAEDKARKANDELVAEIRRRVAEPDDIKAEWLRIVVEGDGNGFRGLGTGKLPESTDDWPVDLVADGFPAALIDFWRSVPLALGRRPDRSARR